MKNQERVKSDVGAAPQNSLTESETHPHPTPVTSSHDLQTSINRRSSRARKVADRLQL